METAMMNLLLADELNEWDPFHIGGGSYDTEIADAIQAVHMLSDEMKLAERLQSIYEFSFEELIPFENCIIVAKKLLSIKNESSCAL
ncbi:DUF1871 domain-containing protein [Neobacillus piezotolerans]|uniref:DUF1871 domain-containing protein n=1 Tax=Neobacillus piezotolerans TaxID=2259171 RepID=A0A3D8GRK4_9BACI|nr:DUF1871 family protein [Neobacillus piezotolerans]RDU36901.1 DUF1871 domain-containing protein [Neobacillus piezotolerans]